MRRRSLIGGVIASASTLGIATWVRAQGDMLPSWNDGPAKASLVDFVTRTTTAGGRDWVPVPERIATFDNDGTLWAEQPVYFQVAFAVDRVKALAPQNPGWKQKEPFKSVLAGDRAALAKLGAKLCRVAIGLALVAGRSHSNTKASERPSTADDLEQPRGLALERAVGAPHGVGGRRRLPGEPVGDPLRDLRPQEARRSQHVRRDGGRTRQTIDLELCSLPPGEHLTRRFPDELRHHVTSASFRITT